LRSREIRGALQRSLDQFVHASVADDSTEAHKHRGFIAAHLASGFAALALVPLSLVSNFGVSSFAPTALAILGLESLAALYVSRTGRLGEGYLLSSIILTALVSWVALHTGGLSSFAIVWFAIAPIEAAMSGRRRVIGFASLAGVLGFAIVALMSLTGVAASPLAFPGGSIFLNTLASVLGLSYALGVAVSIEKRERMAVRLVNLQERRYRLLADSMSDVVTCHGADGDITFASPAAKRMLGIRPSDLLGDGLFRRVNVADRPAYLSALSSALHEGEGLVRYRVRRGDDPETDGWLWVESTMRRSDDTSVEGASVVTVTRDISDRKAHEDALEDLGREAEAASFAKTRFLANMSHELRTPLNAIIGFSDILAQELFGKFEFERQREYSGLIKESGEHLLQVVNDILDMSKIEAGSFDVTPEPFDLKPVIERCTQFVAPQAEKARIAISVEVDPTLPELTADPRACRQILLNLLSNAIKFSNAGGSVTCGARKDGRRIVIFVRDHGIGIAKTDLPRLGNPFVQAESGYDRRHEGSGLGLSVVKGLAALHGGQMSIASELGQGTEVTVSLPIAPAREQIAHLPKVQKLDEGTRLSRRA
jgi:two-component system, cell cycle sensor histidine kinase DivJ